jgi:hypothetical protein
MSNLLQEPNNTKGFATIPLDESLEPWYLYLDCQIAIEGRIRRELIYLIATLIHYTEVESTGRLAIV